MAGHTYTAVVEWTRREGESGRRYSRAHRWVFDRGLEVPASASPLHVREPYSRADAVDPEEAFVAALSSCHMLFFLHLATEAGFAVERYRDEAVGRMGRSETGAEFIETVALRPVVAFGGERRPSEAEIAALHHRSHEACYIANSVRTEVTIESPVEAP